MTEPLQQFDDSVNQFLENLRRSELVAESDIQSALQESSDGGRNTQPDPDALLMHFVRQGMLTRWQSEKLARGRYKGFFLGKYRLLDHLGTGGMSTVYLAEQQLTGQKRAIKVLPRNKTQERSYLARFYREGKAVAALNDPNIVRIYDIAQQGDTHYMVMEYVQGHDLFDIVNANGPLDFELAADCIRQAARGLSHAHGKHLIHRDIKPANLFRTNTGVIKVLDLGLALLKSDAEDHGLSRQHNERTMGTADYLAPEQAIDSHDVDQRADIYSLGCTLFYLLTGQPPFSDGTLAQRIAAHQTKQPPAVKQLRPDCPDLLEDVCHRMMQKHPGDRYQDCDEVITALESGDALNRAVCIDAAGVNLPQQASHRKVQPLPEDRRQSAKRKLPLTAAVLLCLLVLVPTGLAIILMLSKPGESPAVSVDRNGYAGASARGKVASDAGSQNRFGSSSQPSDQPVLNPVATSPATNRSSVLVDFESTDSMRERRGAWDLLSDNVVVGTLLHKRNAQFAARPAGNAARPQGRCLLLRGDSDEVEFRPADTNSRIDRVQFLALRQSAGLPCRLVIEAKSRERFERWQVISEFEKEIDGIEFSRIEIGPLQFSQAESRKFRFKIVGNQESGVYIDDLEIHLR